MKIIDNQICQNSTTDSNSEGYVYVFNISQNLSEITLPLIISHFIKSYLISKKDFFKSFWKKQNNNWLYLSQKRKKLIFHYILLQNFMQDYILLNQSFIIEQINI